MESAVTYAQGKLDLEMQIVVMCETFGWTYQQYIEQPTWFIELIREKMKIDSQIAENQAKKH